MYVYEFRVEFQKEANRFLDGLDYKRNEDA